MYYCSFRNPGYLLLKNCHSFNLGFLRSEYQSAISLKALYPTSSMKITTPVEDEINARSKQKFTGYIPLEKLKISSTRSSGPGGQHVNKINTKVEVRFNLASADWIPEDIRQKLLKVKSNNLTKEGELIIRSDKTRSQQLNLADVLQRLRSIIYKYEELNNEPDPELEHTIRKRKERANELRLKTKQFRSLLKLNRRDSE